MTDQEVYPQVVQTLKTMLKSRKISYADLATAVNMSESGVKKVFLAKDVSLGKLLQICRVLGVSLTDLLLESNRSDFQDTSYTQEQQAYFLGNMDCFHFFWKLAFERMPLEEIEAEFRMDHKRSFGFLRKLDSLKLLRLLPGNKIQLPKIRKIRNFGDGPLMQKIYHDWAKELMQEIARPKVQDDELFIIRYFKVRPETYREFLRALQDLESEFVKRAIREMLLHPAKSLMHMRWVSALAPRSFVSQI